MQNAAQMTRTHKRSFMEREREPGTLSSGPVSGSSQYRWQRRSVILCPSLTAHTNYRRRKSVLAADVNCCSAVGLLLAQSRHHAAEFRCPLLGVKRTLTC